MVNSVPHENSNGALLCVLHCDVEAEYAQAWNRQHTFGVTLCRSICLNLRPDKEVARCETQSTTETMEKKPRPWASY